MRLLTSHSTTCRLWRGPTVLLAPNAFTVKQSIRGDPPILAGLDEVPPSWDQHRPLRVGATDDDSSRGPMPVLLLHGNRDSTKADESYSLAASHGGNTCRLLLCDKDDHRLQTLCQGDLFVGMLVDMLCGVVGFMDDPATGMPSHAGEKSQLARTPYTIE